MINKALSNVQIKTDILTVEKIYRTSHEYGFLQETDTVKAVAYTHLDVYKRQGSDSLAYIPTPMGLQEFIIQTSHYEVGEEKIELAYQLQNKEGVPFANYRLEITWG